MQISFEHDIAKVLPKLDAIGQKQLPFAIARALTQTTKEAQAAVRADMPRKFTIRRQWVVQGIRIIPATKANLTAILYTKDPFMERQEGGGVKTGKPGGGNFTSNNLPSKTGFPVRGVGRGRVAVPTQNVLRSKRDIIRRSELPAGLGSKAFVIAGNAGTQLLARRFAKGKRAGLQVLYVLKGQTFVKPRLELREIGSRVAKQRFPEIFARSIADAIANAK
jgi:hypothetical protein